MSMNRLLFYINNINKKRFASVDSIFFLWVNRFKKRDDKKNYHLLYLEVFSTDHMACFLTITQFQPVVSHAQVNL